MRPAGGAVTARTFCLDLACAVGPLLAALLAASTAHASPTAATPTPAPGWPETEAEFRMADFDLGASSLPQGTGLVGPLLNAFSLHDRLDVGFVLAPLAIGVIWPGSTAPNLFLRVQLLGGEHWAVAVQTQPTFIRFHDASRNGLHVRLWALPARLVGHRRIGDRWTIAGEVGGVYAVAEGSRLRGSAARVFGAAASRSAYVGMRPYLRLLPWLTVWARARALLWHMPLRGNAVTELNNGTRVEVEAQATGSELREGLSATLGAHLTVGRVIVSAGVGYGTWFLPWLLMPYGDVRPFGELELHVRF